MKMTYTLGAIAVSLTMAAVPAQAIDVGSADCTVLPGGTTPGMPYLQRPSSDKSTVDGNRISGSGFEADIAILRRLNYVTLGKMPAAFQVVAPFTSIDTANIGIIEQDTSEGVSDLTLGLTLWPVQPDNPETGTTLGVSLFAILPTGTYDPERIGIGEGTFTIAPQVGLSRGLGGGSDFDGVLDVARQGDHRENRQTYDSFPAWQLQAMLRKQWGPTSALAIGYSGQCGGEQKEEGVKTGLKVHRDQARICGTHFRTPTTQLQAMYGKDFKVEGGFEYDSIVQLRLVKVL